MHVFGLNQSPLKFLYVNVYVYKYMYLEETGFMKLLLFTCTSCETGNGYTHLFAE